MWVHGYSLASSFTQSHMHTQNHVHMHMHTCLHKYTHTTPELTVVPKSMAASSSLSTMDSLSFSTAYVRVHHYVSICNSTSTVHEIETCPSRADIFHGTMYVLASKCVKMKGGMVCKIQLVRGMGGENGMWKL